jgi:hypothetical protein
MARMLTAGGQSKGAIPDFLGKMIGGIGAGVILNALVDISRLPGLSEVGMFGNTTANNFETVASALATGGAVAGIFDVFTGNTILGFSKTITPVLLGYLIGSQQWNAWIAAKIGVDKFNPYQELLGVIPEVPIIPGEFGPEELGLGPEGPGPEEMGMAPEEMM